MKYNINNTRVPTFTCSLKNPPVLYSAIFSAFGNILVKINTKIDNPLTPIINSVISVGIISKLINRIVPVVKITK